MKHRAICVIVSLAGMLAIAGCGSSDTGQVSGVVTLNGQKVGGADLSFASLDNSDNLFSGVTSRNGTYQLTYLTPDGMPVGKYAVRISINTLPSGVPFPPGEKADDLRDEGRLVQKVYTFEKDIVAGENVVDFELSQGQKVE